MLESCLLEDDDSRGAADLREVRTVSWLVSVLLAASTLPADDDCSGAGPEAGIGLPALPAPAEEDSVGVGPAFVGAQHE